MPGQTQYVVPARFSSALGLDEIERLFDTLLPLLFATCTRSKRTAPHEIRSYLFRAR